MPSSAQLLEEVVERVRGEHPQLPLLLGGQGSGSPRLSEGTQVDDLERLEERVPPV
jgi:hypothetical protein